MSTRAVSRSTKDSFSMASDPVDDTESTDSVDAEADEPADE